MTKFWIQLLFRMFAVRTLCSSRTTPDHTQPVLQPRFYNNRTLIHCLALLSHLTYRQLNTFGTFWITVSVRVFHHLTRYCSNAEALREEWEAIPQQDIRSLVHSMRRRITALYPSQRWPHTILIMLIVLCNPEVAWYSIFLLFICLCV